MQFLQYDQLGSLCGGLADKLLQTLDVAGDIGSAVLLHHSYFYFSHYLYRLY